MSKPSPAQIDETFQASDDHFGGDKSTEFLIAFTADKLGISYSDVVAGLAAVHAK